MALYEVTSEPVPLDFECTMEKNIIERHMKIMENQ